MYITESPIQQKLAQHCINQLYFKKKKRRGTYIQWNLTQLYKRMKYSRIQYKKIDA